jgi:hypothetical protein
MKDLIISLLCISQLMLLQAFLRLKIKIHKMELENESRKREK